MKIFIQLLLVTLLLISNLSCSQLEPADWAIGSWTGTASAGQEQTAIRINVREVAPEIVVDIDLLDLGVIGIPTRDPVITENTLELAIPSDSGLQPVLLERQTENLLTGTWSETGKVDARLRLQSTDLFTLPSEQRLTSQGDAGSLGLSVIMPENTSPPLAGVVFVHGSGPEARDASRYAAIRLAESGIASAFFDKRGVGESTGNWQDADFNELASDVLAVTETFAATTGLSMNQIGFIATSQGGWVAPLAASMTDELGFLITISGPATTPKEEGHWNVVRELRLAGFAEAVVSRADAIMDLWDLGIMQDGDFSEYIQALNAARNEDWFAQTSMERIYSTDLPEWFINWYQPVMNFDPMPYLADLDMPMLAIQGDQDEEQPWDRTADLLESLAQAGNDISIYIYNNVNHAMHLINPDGTSPRWPGRPTDFYDRQINFILESVD
tara:strand:- start:1025 stop:2353 length:1329 start_codon:yes stop_codon:yes gene_type:complete